MLLSSPTSPPEPAMSMTYPAAVMPPAMERPSGWRPPFVAAALVWNVMAVLGALASYGDAQHAAHHLSFAMALLRFVLLYLPLTLLSLVLALGLNGAQPERPRVSRLLLAYVGALLVFVPVLCCWQGAIVNVFHGQPVPSLLALLERETALSWWFYVLVMTVTFGGHLAYGAMRHAHAQTLAWQLTQQGNLSLRLRLLQGQLEPYFLSSSLAGVRKLIRTEQRAQATRALARLSDLLRYAIRSSQSDWQSVADEIQFMRDYVDMQSLCHGATLAVDWQLEQCDWADYRCPPLLLFPMLDQALAAAMAHGAPPQPIAVGVVSTRGVDAAQVQVQVSYPGATGTAATLADLRERLAMLYNGAATLNIRHDAGLTLIELAYPVVRNDD